MEEMTTAAEYAGDFESKFNPYLVAIISLLLVIIGWFIVMWAVSIRTSLSSFGAKLDALIESMGSVKADYQLLDLKQTALTNDHEALKNDIDIECERMNTSNEKRFTQFERKYVEDLNALKSKIDKGLEYYRRLNAEVIEVRHKLENAISTHNRHHPEDRI